MKWLEGKKTMITAIVMGLYNMLVAVKPGMAEMINPETVNNILMAAIAFFLRMGIKND